METYLKIVTRDLKIELKGGVDFIKEVLNQKLYDVLDLASAKYQAVFQESDEELENIDANDKIPAAQEAEKGSEIGLEKEKGFAKHEILTPSLKELKSRAKLGNNKELVTLVVYYSDFCLHQPPGSEDIRRLLKEELCEKPSILISLSTYLQRAKKEGWVNQEGKRWRMTGAGIEKVREWLKSA